MADIDYLDCETRRGYRVCMKRITVQTDQGETHQDSYVAIRPLPEAEVFRSGNIRDVYAKVDSSTISFAELDGYVLEITHDAEDFDATNVNTYSSDGTLLKSGRFPQNGGAAELRAILPADLAAPGIDVAEVLQILRSRPLPQE